jgi:hypothetical protein
MTLAERVQAFRSDLAAFDNAGIMDRWYYSGDCAALHKTQEAALRRAVSNRFGVSIRDVVVVGSARLGFTLVPKPARPPFSFFDGNDIDVAIISQNLFTEFWGQTLAHWTDYGDWTKAEKFRLYLFRGWLRPDMLPTGKGFARSDEWFDFFRGQQASGDYGGYRINAGIYYDEKFLEKYSVTSLEKCRSFVRDGL